MALPTASSREERAELSRRHLPRPTGHTVSRQGPGGRHGRGGGVILIFQKVTASCSLGGITGTFPARLHLMHREGERRGPQSRKKAPREASRALASPSRGPGAHALSAGQWASSLQGWLPCPCVCAWSVQTGCSSLPVSPWCGRAWALLGRFSHFLSQGGGAVAGALHPLRLRVSNSLQRKTCV